MNNLLNGLTSRKIEVAAAARGGDTQFSSEIEHKLQKDR